MCRELQRSTHLQLLMPHAAKIRGSKAGKHYAGMIVTRKPLPLETIRVTAP